MRSIKIIKKDQELLIYYQPSYNFDSIVKGLKERKKIKKTFWISKDNLVEVNEDEEYILFRIASIKGEYYCLDKEVFNIKNNIYIRSTINITGNWFISYPHISIFLAIDKTLSQDLFITEDNDGIDNHIPVEDFAILINNFPNAYERDKYSEARIAYLLSNYVDGTWKFKESFDKYLNKKEKSLVFKKDNVIKLLGYDMYKKAADELNKMLKNTSQYSEQNWQEKIYEIICVLYPKYINKFREIIIGSDGRHSKKPDFLLVDSSGFVDILEIKKPDISGIISSTKYRDNYVASRDLEGAIVQIEKYIYILNHEGEDRAFKIYEQIKDNLPDGFKLKVVNPQGILLLGRSEGLSNEQLYDLEIIKRQHKNIIDIMTYDDLMNRFNNILKQMELDIEIIENKL